MVVLGRPIVPIPSSDTMNRYCLYEAQLDRRALRHKNPVPTDEEPFFPALVAGRRSLITFFHGTSPTPLLLCRRRQRQFLTRRRAFPRVAAISLATNPQTRSRTRRSPVRSPRPLRSPDRSWEGFPASRAVCPA